MAILLSQIIVLAVGVTVIVLAAWGILAPAKLMTLVMSAMDKDWGIYVAVGVRLALGTALIIAAPASPVPVGFWVLGVIAIVAGVALALMGRERVRGIVVWWSERMSVPVIRLWLLFGIAFGAFLIYGVLLEAVIQSG